MKKYCYEHLGTFCFSRLIYTSRSWCPAAIEHGLLRTDSTFWVRKFKNATVKDVTLTEIQVSEASQYGNTTIPVKWVFSSSSCMLASSVRRLFK